MLFNRICQRLPSLRLLHPCTSKPRLTSLIVLASCFLVFACEAPLVLDKVSAQHDKALQRTDFYQAFAQNDQVAALVGNSGVVLTSDDAQTWARTILPGEPALLDIDNCPDQRLIALSFNNKVWVSSAKGDNWTAIDIPTNEQLMTIDCAPNGDWWVAGGYSTFLHSSDAGNSWQSSTLDEDAIVTNLVFLTQTDAIATAEFGMILASQDGGASWDFSGYLPDEFYPHSAYFTNMSEGWVGGLNGFIYHTTDGGNSWQQQSADSAIPIYQFVQADGVLYALGDNATVLSLNDTKWHVIQPATAPVYLRAALYFKNKLLVAGGRGMFLTLDPNIAALPADEMEQKDGI